MKAQDFVKQLTLKSRKYHFFDIKALHKKGIADVRRLPFTIKILVENLLRKLDGRIVTEEDLVNIARWEGIDPETALRTANSKFFRRFSCMEDLCRQRNLVFADLSFDEKNALWDEAKDIIGKEN